jgi:hypothetical protein
MMIFELSSVRKKFYRLQRKLNSRTSSKLMAHSFLLFDEQPYNLLKSVNLSLNLVL